MAIAWCSEEHDDPAYLSRRSLFRARQVHVVADLKLQLYETATGDGLVCHDRLSLKPVIIRLRSGAIPAGLRVGARGWGRVVAFRVQARFAVHPGRRAER